jgi:Tfp pilus assembly protein PilF
LLLLVVVLLALAALLTVWRTRGEEASASVESLPAPAGTPHAGIPNVAAADFVGSEACASCHRAQFDAWSRSTHAAAGGTPGSVRVIAPFDGRPIRFRDAVVVPTSSGGRPAFIVRQDGHEERTFAVDAVIGGGHMEGGGTQGFASHFADGTYRFLPFDFSRHERAWFCNTISRADRGWVPLSAELALADCGDWPPSRILGDEPRFTNCQSCHGSQITVSLDSSAAAYRTRFTTLGINCESCHGPGRRHLALVRDSTARRTGEIGMVSFATLGKDASLGVCWQCHALKDQLRSGYVAGLPLDRYYSLLLPQLGDQAHFADGRVRTFAYQQGHLFSDCYRNGGMTCTSCHDPHRQSYRDVAGAPLPGRFDDRQCTSCHQSKARAPETHTKHAAASAGSRCVACHMPYLQEPELEDAVQYARSDHAIPIPRPAFDAALGVVNACMTCHRDRTANALDAQVRTWYGDLKPHPRAVTAALRADSVTDRETAARELLVADETHTAALVTGVASFVERFLQRDMEALERDVVTRLRALATHAHPDVRALALAALHHARGNDAAVRRFLTERLRADATDDRVVRARWSAVLGFLADQSRANGDAVGAVTTYEKALEIEPDNPRILLNLGVSLNESGNAAGAVERIRQSLALDERQPLAHVNLGIAYQALDRPDEAASAYRRALVLNEHEPLAWFNLGNLALQADDAATAQQMYERALEADPSIVLAHFYLARILASRGDLRGALREVERGLEFDPRNEEGLSARDQLRQRLRP